MDNTTKKFLSKVTAALEGVKKEELLDVLMNSELLEYAGDVLTDMISEHKSEASPSPTTEPVKKKPWNEQEGLSPKTRAMLESSNAVRAHLATTSTVYNDKRQQEAVDTLYIITYGRCTLQEWAETDNPIHGDTYDLLMNIIGTKEDASEVEKEALVNWNHYLTMIPFLFDHKVIHREDLTPQDLRDYLDSVGLLKDDGVQLLPTSLYQSYSTLLKNKPAAEEFLRLIGLADVPFDYDKCRVERNYTKFFMTQLVTGELIESKPWLFHDTHLGMYNGKHEEQFRPADCKALCTLSTNMCISGTGSVDITDWIATKVIPEEQDLTASSLTRIFDFYELSPSERERTLRAAAFPISNDDQLKVLQDMIDDIVNTRRTTCVVEFPAPYESGQFLLYSTSHALEIYRIPFVVSGERSLVVTVPANVQEEYEHGTIAEYIREWGTRFGFGVVVRFMS